jgi:hypothetical protein
LPERVLAAEQRCALAAGGGGKVLEFELVRVAVSDLDVLDVAVARDQRVAAEVHPPRCLHEQRPLRPEGLELLA